MHMLFEMAAENLKVLQETRPNVAAERINTRTPPSAAMFVYKMKVDIKYEILKGSL